MRKKPRYSFEFARKSLGNLEMHGIEHKGRSATRSASHFFTAAFVVLRGSR